MADESKPLKFWTGEDKNSAWSTGRSSASIAFVSLSERYIAKSRDPFAIGLLVDQINKIKSGKTELSTPLTPEEFILRAQQR